MTLSWAMKSNRENQTPISSALCATGLLTSHTYLWASRRISIQLLRRANSGARGKAATNIVMNPYWSTEGWKNMF